MAQNIDLLLCFLWCIVSPLRYNVDYESKYRIDPMVRSQRFF